MSVVDRHVSLPALSIRTRTDAAAVVAAELCLLDGLLTLPFWAHETNPVVLGLGPSGMLLVKLAAVAGLLWTWFAMDGVQDFRTARACVWGVCGLYAAVVVSNVAYLLTMA